MNRMSAKDYRELVVKPALEEENGDVEFVNKLTRVDKKERKNEEDELTKMVANYLEELKIKGKVLCYSHIPASTYTTSWSQKAKNKAMGVRPGVPDMLIVFPDEVLFLELKREKGGVLSLYQDEWISALNSSGVPAKLARGWDQAKEIIDSFLK